MKLAVLFAALFTGLCFAADAKEDAVKADKAKLKGTWEILSVEENGQKAAIPEGVKMKMVFQDDKLFLQFDDKKSGGAYTIDPTQKPPTIDLVFDQGRQKGKTIMGIYSIDKEEMKICTAFNSEQDRPKEFSAKEKTTLFILKREKE